MANLFLKKNATNQDKITLGWREMYKRSGQQNRNLTTEATSLISGQVNTDLSMIFQVKFLWDAEE